LLTRLRRGVVIEAGASTAVAGSAAARLQAWALPAAVACMVMLGLLSLLNMAALEFGPRAGQAIQVDELYFSACAARGRAVGHVPVAGCHDNKGPLIFLVHQWVQMGAFPYSQLAVKRAAFGVVALIVALSGWLAWRIAGRLAGFAAVAMVSLTLTVDAHHLALKTEIVGAVFLLMSLVLLVGRQVGVWRWMLSGGLLGLAVLSKQTYGLAVGGMLAWCWLSHTGSPLSTRAGAFARTSLALLGGLAVPLTAIAAVFQSQGALADFLASMFLYPSVYGAPGTSTPLHHLAWRAGAVARDLSMVPVSVALASLATASSLLRKRPTHGSVGYDPAALVLLVTSMMLIVTLVSPVYFRYHILPAWLLMAVAAGIAIGQLAAPLQRSEHWLAAGTSAALMSLALLMGLTSWSTNGKKLGLPNAIDPSSVASEARPGDHAYVLGMMPDFYVYNQLVPASGIQFPWALPGTPASWAYAPPDRLTLRGRALEQMHARNLDRLFEDFRRTPPKYILVMPSFSRSSTSTRVADVPGFDEYLRQHCHYTSTQAGRYGDHELYRCGQEGTARSSGPIAERDPRRR
jgi:hypothetical protein